MASPQCRGEQALYLGHVQPSFGSRHIRPVHHRTSFGAVVAKSCSSSLVQCAARIATSITFSCLDPDDSGVWQRLTNQIPLLSAAPAAQRPLPTSFLVRAPTRIASARDLMLRLCIHAPGCLDHVLYTPDRNVRTPQAASNVAALMLLSNGPPNVTANTRVAACLHPRLHDIV